MVSLTLSETICEVSCSLPELQFIHYERYWLVIGSAYCVDLLSPLVLFMCDTFRCVPAAREIHRTRVRANCPCTSLVIWVADTMRVNDVHKSLSLIRYSAWSATKSLPLFKKSLPSYDTHSNWQRCTRVISPTILWHASVPRSGYHYTTTSECLACVVTAVGAL